MSEIEKMLSKVIFKRCKDQAKIGSGCTCNNLEKPTGAIISPITESRLCNLDCTNRDQCSNYKAK